MKASKILSLSAVGATLLVVLAASPALASDNVIHKGVDVWMTVAGFAKTSFEKEPIPAGFFCEGSQPFTGEIVFKGDPLAVQPARRLGAIDTVVRRLDDAVFNDKGEATTRIQLMALSLVSVKPIETRCGAYDVAVSLAGEQPTTTMRIVRTEALGGTYTAPLALNVKVVFTPVGGGNKSGRRELTRRIDLGPGTHSVWTYVTTPQYKGRIRVDTNGDGRVDAALPAASNFLAGVAPAVLKGPVAKPMTVQSTGGASCPTPLCPYYSCHCTPWDEDPTYDDPGTGCASDHLHCVWVCVQYPDRACASLEEMPPP
ncbi:MAG TPA: hypothetical protein VGG03_08175 [Thermoanaerobaculia bacterium]|jgi:hypothetical protein